MNGKPAEFRLGVDTLLAEHADWLRDARVGLVAHAASVDAAGVPTAERLRAAGVNLAALFGPEHGYAGLAGAGEEVPGSRHPRWDIPVYSLYGATRRPTPEMLAGVDVLLFDLQDIGVRCYTYGATLRHVLEAAAEQGCAVIVLDRPIPLAGVVDGPLPEEKFMSFVAALPAPFCYGLTPGATARWLRDRLRLDLPLRIAPVHGTPSETAWVPPSPALRTPACARAYPATVFFEALPAWSVSRQTPQAFREIRRQPDSVPLPKRPAAWARVAALVRGYLSAAAGPEEAVALEVLSDGLRLSVGDLASYRPALTGLALLAALQEVWGSEFVWEETGARPAWFDQLLGTDRVRLALQSGVSPAELAASWAADVASFRAELSGARP